jgi:hypothetical protein
MGLYNKQKQRQLSQVLLLIQENSFDLKSTECMDPVKNIGLYYCLVFCHVFSPQQA